MRTLFRTALTVLVLWGASGATETEHYGLSIVPAPGKVVIDGRFDDWDISGGIFVCGDVETQRDMFAAWFCAMYDRDNLYVLARWIDPTPMNNPGSVLGDFGFQGDCLQFRIITSPDVRDAERCAHLTCWRDRDGADVMDVAYGRRFDQGKIRDARTQGAHQAFARGADGKGYVQEIALPWKLLTTTGQPPQPGDTLRITVEPNFTVGAHGRLTIKDIFRPGKPPDRVFTFMASADWGVGTIEPRGNLPPRPVRLSDGREFAVRMEGGLPAVDWTGLIKSVELPGFKPIAFEMPEDGHISLNIFAADGTVVRQLLSSDFRTRGRHEVKWDGLTTPIWRKPGQPVPAGAYTWSALWHKGIGLRLRGWACNGGSVPWDSGPTGNWGGDHGVPSAAVTDGKLIFLGWTGAEAGKALVACDMEGRVRWRNTHGGMGGAPLVAVDGGVVYVVRETAREPGRKVTFYRLDAATGGYSAWKGADSAAISIDSPSAIDAFGGRVYLACAARNEVQMIDGRDASVAGAIPVPSPSAIRVVSDKLAYVISDSAVLAVELPAGRSRAVVSGLANPASLTVDAAGLIYVGVREPDNQVHVFSPEGRLLRSIGRKGGRPATGPWVADGMKAIAGMCVDRAGRLWVMEADAHPKRVVVWELPPAGRDGEPRVAREMFGPTHYGASGGAINPLDPTIVVGEGCEWRIDERTGRDRCLGVIERRIAGAARFCIGANGRLYLVTGGGMHSPTSLNIHERLGDGLYKLRARIYVPQVDKGGRKEKAGETLFWADANDDAVQQDAEVASLKGAIDVMGYIAMDMTVGADLTVFGRLGEKQPVRIDVAGFTACGAPKYDLANIRPAGAWGVPSPDNRLLLAGHHSRGRGEDVFRCHDAASGALLWTCPDTFAGVHGSHNAPPPATGLIRGHLGIVGSATLPPPVGRIWAVNTNVGEWHILNERGFYVTRLFQPDPLKVQWPDQAMPGAIMDNAPPGLGGEDFGGSLTQGTDGRLYIQAGKTGLWTLDVAGMENVKAIAGGSVEVTADDVKRAATLRQQLLQESLGTQQITLRRFTPKFTGDLSRDFPGAQIIEFRKQEDAAVRCAAAWDERNLYLGWHVKDATPWMNAAGEPELMYLHGDTVDFQLGTDPAARKDRADAVEGDLRLSIGNFKGAPAAVIYRRMSQTRNPRTFSSGVVKEYVMDSVTVLKDAVIDVRRGQREYVVEAAVPLAALGLAPREGLVLQGDFGATHGDPGGQRTRLRTHWNNQHTGIVDDAVFELKMEPKNWGRLEFR